MINKFIICFLSITTAISLNSMTDSTDSAEQQNSWEEYCENDDKLNEYLKTINENYLSKKDKKTGEESDEEFDEDPDDLPLASRSYPRLLARAAEISSRALAQQYQKKLTISYSKGWVDVPLSSKYRKPKRLKQLIWKAFEAAKDLSNKEINKFARLLRTQINRDGHIVIRKGLHQEDDPHITWSPHNRGPHYHFRFRKTKTREGVEFIPIVHKRPQFPLKT